MTSFSISDGNSTTFVDTTSDDGLIIDFTSLDNSLSVQINGVDLFVGGPVGAENELEFQAVSTAGQTVRFADGDEYEADTQAIWQMNNSGTEPVFRLKVHPNGTVELFGVKADDGTLVPLELYNGMTVNTAAIEAAWNDGGSNTVVLDQAVTGPTNASGTFTGVTCFATGTLIDTENGPVPVERLHPGDRVATYDGTYEPIRWIGSCQVPADRLRANPKLRPILIRADALGPGYPKQDLIVSPQHRILVCSRIAARMFGTQDVLIPAAKLLPLPGVELQPQSASGVEYWHILFDDHQVIWSNGTPSESLYTGPEAMKALPPASRAEIRALFPQVLEPGFLPVSACLIPETGRQMKQLVRRHQANRTPIYGTTDPQDRALLLVHHQPFAHPPERLARIA